MTLSNGNKIGFSNEKIALLLIGRPARTEQGRKVQAKLISVLMAD